MQLTLHYIPMQLSVGYGGFFQNRWFQGGWPSELMLKDNEQLSMAFLELNPIVVSGKQILFYFLIIIA